MQCRCPFQLQLLQKSVADCPSFSSQMYQASKLPLDTLTKHWLIFLNDAMRCYCLNNMLSIDTSSSPVLTKPTCLQILYIYRLSISICLYDWFERLTQSTTTLSRQLHFHHLTDTISTWIDEHVEQVQAQGLQLPAAFLALWSLTQNMSMFTPLITSSPNLHSHRQPWIASDYVPNKTAHISTQASYSTLDNLITCFLSKPPFPPPTIASAYVPNNTAHITTAQTSCTICNKQKWTL